VGKIRPACRSRERDQDTATRRQPPRAACATDRRQRGKGRHTKVAIGFGRISLRSDLVILAMRHIPDRQPVLVHCGTILAIEGR